VIDQNEIEQRVTKVVSETLKVDRSRITPESRFVEDLGADSVDMFTLLTELEDEFSATIAENDAQRLPTVGAVFDFIRERAAQAGPDR
jgi:acyl carrier protein